MRKTEEEYSEVNPDCEKKVVPDNYIVSIDVKTGELARVVSERLRTIFVRHTTFSPKVGGADFYACPRVSKTGYLVWMEWNMPNMVICFDTNIIFVTPYPFHQQPWDTTDIKIANLTKRDEKVSGDSIQNCAGGDKELALTFPEFPAHGGLFYVSDETNWWNLYFV